MLEIKVIINIYYYYIILLYCLDFCVISIALNAIYITLPLN